MVRSEDLSGAFKDFGVLHDDPHGAEPVAELYENPEPGANDAARRARALARVIVAQTKPGPEGKVKEQAREPEDEKEKPRAEQKERSRKAARSGHCVGVL